MIKLGKVVPEPLRVVAFRVAKDFSALYFSEHVLGYRKFFKARRRHFGNLQHLRFGEEFYMRTR